MSSVKWLPSTRSGNPVDLLTTELNSLTTTGSALSAAIDNDADHDMYMDLFLTIDYGVAPTNGSVIECYVVRSYDGTNFEDASTTGPVTPQGGFVGAFVLRNTTDTQIICIPGVVVPPEDFKVMVLAKTTGQTAAASDNTLKALFYGEQVV
jgi:hypothetical protein